MDRSFFNKSPWWTAYIRLVTPNCKACWKCVDACPAKVLGKVSFFRHRHARIAHPDNCTGCMKCVKTCPFKAIIPAGKQQKDTGTNRKMSGKRAIVSIGLSILFILLIVSAIVIEIKEELIMSAIATEIKEELNPQPFSLHVWTAVHVVCGTIFTVFVIFHLVCNWRIFKSYLIRKNK